MGESAAGQPSRGLSAAARRALRITAAFIIALVILSQGITAPFEKDQEPQSAQWVVDIVNHGHWLLPHDYYDFVERKPPLYYWCAALISKAAGGVDETTARAPSLIAGAGLAVVVLEWTALEAGAVSGGLAFFFLLGIYGYASRATTALTDMLMTFLLFGAWFTIYPLFDTNEDFQGPRSRAAAPAARTRRLWRTLGAGAILGLAVLTKGPVAIVLLGLAAFIYVLLLRHNPFSLAQRAWPWATLGVACAIAMAWYVPAFIAGRGSDLTGVFVAENFGHFLPASMGGTGEAARPVYYIVLRMLGGSLPLSFLVLALAVGLIARQFMTEMRKPMLFALAMALAVIVLFSAASAKRDDYILPALPALAIMMAGLFTGVAEKKDGRARVLDASFLRNVTLTAIAAVMLAGVIAAGAYFSAGGMVRGWHLGLQSSDASYAAMFAHGFGRFALPFTIFGVAVALGALAVFGGIWKGRTLWSGAGLALICLAGTSLWTGMLRPEVARTRSLARFAVEVKSRVDDAPVYVVFDSPGLAYYYGRAVPPLPKSVRRSSKPPGQSFYLVARRRELTLLPPAIRDRLRLKFVSSVAGADGPPALYAYDPPADNSMVNARGVAKSGSGAFLIRITR